jgi:hypothetical protein
MGSMAKRWTDTLTRPFELKAGSFGVETKADGSQVGRFEGYLSVFGNEDATGDIVEPGAFTRTIEQNKGRFPLLWFHDPTEPIGIFKAAEDERGLYIIAFINLDTQRGREVYSGMKFEVEELDGDGSYVGELSIGYRAVTAETDEDGIRHLKEVALHEGSLLTMHFAANPEAVVTVKDSGERMVAAEAKALRDARAALEAKVEAITGLLASVPVGDGPLAAERKDTLIETLGFDPFAPPEDPGEDKADDDEEQPGGPALLSDEAAADILAIVEHARATLTA